MTDTVEVDFAQCYADYEQFQKQALAGLMNGTFEKSKVFAYASPFQEVLSPRVVEEALHNTFRHTPNVRTRKAHLDLQGVWFNELLPDAPAPEASTLFDATRELVEKRLTDANQFPNWFPPQGLVSASVADARLYKIYYGMDYGTTDQLSLAGLLLSLPKATRVKHPAYRQLLNGKWFQPGNDAVAMVARDGFIAPWMLTLNVSHEEFHASSVLSYIPYSPFYTTAMAASEATLRKHYPKFGFNQRQALFASHWARRVPLSGDFLTMLQNDLRGRQSPEHLSVGDETGGVHELAVDSFGDFNEEGEKIVSEESRIRMMLAGAVTIPVSSLTWALNHLRISGIGAVSLHRNVLLRVFSDGMLNDWVKREQLDGLPRPLLFSLLEGQFPTWDSLRDLPLNSAPNLKRHPNCDCRERRR